MTRPPAQPDPPAAMRARNWARRARSSALALLLASSPLANSARAAPLALENDADIAAFVERLRAFESASRVRWVVASRTKAEAQAAIERIEAHLGAGDSRLAARLRPQAFDDAMGAVAGPAVRAWIEPQLTSASGGPSCTWQVWVTDPSLPSPTADAATVPLAPNDRLPVSPAATFRVGHTGLLQTRLYAFDETRPGAIRDLATAPDVNVPVAASDGDEMILLAMSRERAPFLESLKSALETSDGRRRELGPQFALRDKFLGKGRGIGANIQEISPAMISRKSADPQIAAAERPNGADAALTETCIYALTPAP